MAVHRASDRYVRVLSRSSSDEERMHEKVCIHVLPSTSSQRPTWRTACQRFWMSGHDVGIHGMMCRFRAQIDKVLPSFVVSGNPTGHRVTLMEGESRADAIGGTEGSEQTRGRRSRVKVRPLSWLARSVLEQGTMRCKDGPQATCDSMVLGRRGKGQYGGSRLITVVRELNAERGCTDCRINCVSRQTAGEGQK